jgi:hypothetical protein
MRLNHPIVLAGVNCTIDVSAPNERTVVVHISGLDTGDLDQRPFAALDEVMGAGGPFDLYIDARDARGPSVDVSAQWAGWLREHRARFHYINMLTRSRFVHLTADFVRRFAELGDRMRVFTDPAAFDTALDLSVRG